jgi:hypothetical protein
LRAIACRCYSVDGRVKVTGHTIIDVDNFTDWLLRDLIGALLFLLVPVSHKPVFRLPILFLYEATFLYNYNKLPWDVRRVSTR